MGGERQSETPVTLLARLTFSHSQLCHSSQWMDGMGLVHHALPVDPCSHLPPVLPWGPSHGTKSFRSCSSMVPPWATAPERAPGGSSFPWGISPCSRGALQELPGVSTPPASPGAEGPSCPMESWGKLLPCPYHCWAGSHPCPSLLSPTAAALRFLPFLGGGSSSSAGLGPGTAALEPAGPKLTLGPHRERGQDSTAQAGEGGMDHCGSLWE